MGVLGEGGGNGMIPKFRAWENERVVVLEELKIVKEETK